MFKDEAKAKEGATQTEKEEITSSKTKSTNISYVHMYKHKMCTYVHMYKHNIYSITHKRWDFRDDRTRFINCVFLYIHDSLGNCKLAKSLNKPPEDYIQGILYEV